jgi:hypothetical protein
MVTVTEYYGVYARTEDEQPIPGQSYALYALYAFYASGFIFHNQGPLQKVCRDTDTPECQFTAACRGRTRQLPFHPASNPQGLDPTEGTGVRL